MGVTQGRGVVTRAEALEMAEQELHRAAKTLCNRVDVANGWLRLAELLPAQREVVVKPILNADISTAPDQAVRFEDVTA